MTLFPEDLIQALKNENKKIKRKKKNAKLRGGGLSASSSFEREKIIGRKRRKKASVQHRFSRINRRMNNYGRIIHVCQEIVRWIFCI